MVLGLAAVVAIAAVTATLTDAMTVTSNTYTFGNVSIELRDDSVDVGPIAPGKTISRKATIKNTGALPAYVFLKVDMPTDGGHELFEGPSAGSGWVDITSGAGVGAGTHVFAYATSSSALTPLDTKASVTQLGDITYKDASTKHADVQVTVTAYAIQTTDVFKDDAASKTAVDYWKLVKGVDPRR